MGERAGKILAPVEHRHAFGVRPEEDFQPSPELLDWRALLCRTHLEGFNREVVASSELLEFSETRILLRARSRSFVSVEFELLVSKAVSEASGRNVTVRFAEGECSAEASCVAKLIASERARAQRALVEAFRSDPFVQKCLKTFNATLDEASVRAVDETETEEEL